MSDVIGILLTTPRRPLATSAMPDAPVVDDARHRSRAARRVIAAALRGLGGGSRRLADRVEPAPRPDGSCAPA
jgi:hypothetical protein